MKVDQNDKRYLAYQAAIRDWYGGLDNEQANAPDSGPSMAGLMFTQMHIAAYETWRAGLDKAGLERLGSPPDPADFAE